MANTLKMQSQYGIAATVTFAAVLNKDDIVRVTANNTVDAAAATHIPRGYVVKSPTAANETGTVMLKGRAVVKIKTAADCAVNIEVKMAALSSGANTVTPWVQGTDNEGLKLGWVLESALSGADATVVLY